MNNKKEVLPRLPGPLEAVLVLIASYFITYFITISIAGLFNPQVIKNPQILTTSKLFFISSQILLIILPFVYFQLKGFDLIQIFRIRPVPGDKLLWVLLLSLGILPLSDELDRLVQLLFNFDAPDASLFAVFKTDSVTGFLIIFITISILAPVFEEFFFRGVLQQTYERKAGVINAIIFSSLFWTLFHPVLSWTVQIFILGLLLGVLSFYYRSTFPAIIIHGISNFFSLILINMETSPVLSHYQTNGHVHWFWLVTGSVFTILSVKKLFAEPPLSS